MSSSPTTPKPYKSRLFNFVNRHYIKINSQINTKFREWGYVIKGGLQGVLLPFLWLWQKATNINKGFTASKKPSASLPPSPCDEVIVTVREKMIEEDFPLLLTHDFQGLASQIKDQKIVAVLENNKIKDIIPTQKQGEIFLLITSIVETYEDKHNKSHLIIWIDKLFAQVEGIILRGEFTEEETGLNNCSQGDSIDVNEKKNFSLQNIIKAAIDYFFGGKKSPYHLKLEIENNIDSLPSQNDLNSLPSSDNQENNLPSLSTFQKIVKQSQKTLENLVPVVKNVTVQIINQGLNQVNNIAQNLENNVNKKDYDPFQIKLIILAAIEFFFYKNGAKSSLNFNSNQSVNPLFLNTDLFLMEGQIEDPWLCWDDLYGDNNNDLIIENDDEESQVYYLTETEEDKTIITTLSKGGKTSLPIEKIDNNNNISINHTEKTNQSLMIEKEDNITIKKVEIQEAIETKVIEIRYEKHFLEVILEKLDQLILWFEELILMVIKIIKKK